MITLTSGVNDEVRRSAERWRMGCAADVVRGEAKLGGRAFKIDLDLAGLILVGCSRDRAATSSAAPRGAVHPGGNHACRRSKPPSLCC